MEGGLVTIWVMGKGRESDRFVKSEIGALTSSAGNKRDHGYYCSTRGTISRASPVESQHSCRPQNTLERIL